MQKWEWYDVVDYFDSHLNVTLRELSGMSGWRVEDIKRLLMEQN